MSLTRSLPPRPHPLARSPRVEKLSAFLERAWDKGWMPPPVLVADELWAIAAKNYPPEAEFGGRSEEDAADFRLRLERLTKAARESMDFHREQWDAMSAAAVETAKNELGVKFIEVEKGPFIEAVLPMHEEAAEKSPVVADLIGRIKAIAPQ